jgi:arginyl-tRNA synthetase
MNIFETFKFEIKEALKELQTEGILPEVLDLAKVTCEPPRDSTHGDIATNAAMVISKLTLKNPREIAELLVEKLKSNQAVQDASIAGPGFINLHLKEEFWFKQLSEILHASLKYGESQIGQGLNVNVEYVSTNPTGPIHVGHCRGAIFGDVLCNLLEKAGFSVTREYYVNDAGAQIDKLAHSVHQRYLEALGHKIEAIEGYPGDYLIPVGEKLAKQEGNKWEKVPSSEWLPYFRDQSVNAMMSLIREDLELLGVKQDVFTSEKEIIAGGKVEEALKVLEDQALLYKGVLEAPKGKTIEDWESREQLLFKSTQFGDDVDRAIIKSDGTWSYFTPDIAYHYDKFKRGANVLIDVLGADHTGYVKRISSAVKAISRGMAEVDVKVCQLVKFIDKGQPLKMSKRAGTFITVREVIEKVGKDALRFIMLTRKNDAPLDFDFTKVAEKSKDNPVFYVQYAHARIHSVKRQLEKIFPQLDMSYPSLIKVEWSFIKSSEEIQLIKTLANWPRQVEIAAQTHEPHRLAFYLYDLAAQFHALWNNGKENATLRFIHENNYEKTKAKVALIQAVENVIGSGLAVFGIKAVEEM